MSEQTSHSLFPAYTPTSNASSHSDVCASNPVFDCKTNEHTQTSHSLFPAYIPATSSGASSHSDDQKKEWLTNESFTNETLKILAQNEILRETEKEASIQDLLLVEEIPTNEILHAKKPKTTAKNDASSHKNLSALQQHLNKAIFLEETGLSCERAFRIDKYYDPENLLLESLDSKTIPKYRCKATVPLGISKDELAYWIPKQSSSKASNRYFSKGSVKQLRTLPGKVQPLKDVFELPTFVPFSSSPVKPIIAASSMTNFDGVSSDWKVHFNNSLKTSVNKDSTFEVRDVELHEKIVSYNSALTELPHDEQLWLDFVAFQHDLFNSSSYEKCGSAMELSLYEKQIAILDKALKHNPNSVLLSVAKLEILKNMQEKEKLISSWDNLMFYHPNNVVAWKHYFQFILSDIAYFTVPRITKLFSKCLGTLANILEGKVRSHRVTPELLPNLLDVFGCLCSVFRSFGHREFALGLFQAEIEFNLFAPSFVSNIEVSEEKVACFEPFWDSGAPRVGEENAVGWANTIKSKTIIPNPSASVLGLETLEDEILQKKLPLWQLWLEFELLRESFYWLPWRPDLNLDQETEDLDDPNRTVAFEQISVFLIRISDDWAKFSLFCEFLLFLGVCLHSAECSFFFRNSEHSVLVLEDFRQTLLYIKDVFPQHKIPEILKLSCPKNPDTHSSFVENVFKQSIDAFLDKYKTLVSFVWFKHNYHTSYLNSDIKSSKNAAAKLKKFCKGLLKRPENRNCLYLWNEYIHIEWISGCKEKANQTFETLFSSSTNIDEDLPYMEVWYFVRKHVERLLGIQSVCKTTFVANRNKALWILCSLAQKSKFVLCNSDQKVSPSNIIRATAGFKTLLSKVLEGMQLEEAAMCRCVDPCSHPVLDCVSCSAIFQYIVKGLDSAFEQYESIKTALKAKTVQFAKHSRYLEEQIEVYKAELLNFHCWSSWSLKPLQTHLYDVIERFPGNVKLLHLLLKIKTAAPVIGPTRSFFYKLIKSSKQVTSVTWLFAIISELLICFSIQKAFSWNLCASAEVDETSLLSDCGLVWKVRYLFERALKSPSSRHCVALWRSHIKYEMTVGETQKAKAVLHQALQTCSWAKALYLDGVQYFPEDLKYFLKMMNEKQLRIHTPLEEIELLGLTMEQAEKDD